MKKLENIFSESKFADFGIPTQLKNGINYTDPRKKLDEIRNFINLERSSRLGSYIQNQRDKTTGNDRDYLVGSEPVANDESLGTPSTFRTLRISWTPGQIKKLLRLSKAHRSLLSWIFVRVRSGRLINGRCS